MTSKLSNYTRNPHDVLLQTHGFPSGPKPSLPRCKGRSPRKAVRGVSIYFIRVPKSPKSSFLTIMVLVTLQKKRTITSGSIFCFSYCGAWFLSFKKIMYVSSTNTKRSTSLEGSRIARTFIVQDVGLRRSAKKRPEIKRCF